MSSKISPNRRRSISVLNQGTSSRPSQQHRRRAYSIAPGEKLSPAAKARRVMMPRKSILKASINIPPDLSPETSATIADESNATQTIDLTDVHNTTRSRRVSFAAHAFVRLFTKESKNTNGDVPGSSPERPASQDVNENENQDHIPRSRRRSSRRRSSTTFSELGEQSMEMDDEDMAPDPSQFRDGEEYRDAGFSDQEQDGEDMDLTEAVDQKIIRKRSLSLSGGQTFLPRRRRSSTIPVATSSHTHSENQLPEHHHGFDPNSENALSDHDQDLTDSQSFMSEGSSGDHTQPMEFTVPMGQALHPPANEDPVWQQLRAATHAGHGEPHSDDPPHNEDDIGEPMELTVAMGRLIEARKSLGLPPSDIPPVGLHSTSEDEGDTQADTDADDNIAPDDTFTSTEDSSFRDVDELGDQTINVTQTMKRNSMGQDSTMDMTGVLGGEIRMGSSSVSSTDSQDALPELSSGRGASDQSQPHPPLEPFVFGASSTDPPRVFSAPQPKPPAPTPRSPLKAPASATVPKPFTFTLPPKFTNSRDFSSPSKLPIFKGTAAFAPPTIPKSPKKRAHPDDSLPSHDTDQPSAAKRQAVTRLSPAKKTAIEPVATKTTSSQESRRASAVRRPSGYFAQRKSLGGNFAAPLQPAGPGNPPPKKSTIGRASLGSAATSRKALYPDVAAIRSEIPPSPATLVGVPTDDTDKRSGREKIGQATTAPSPTRGSPSPASLTRIDVSKTAEQDTTPSGGEHSGIPIRMYPLLERSVSPVERRGSMAEAVRMTPDFSPPPDPPLTMVTIQEDIEMEEDPLEPSAAPVSTQGGIQEDDIIEDDEPAISIEQFFDMTEIKFMDGVTAPRRSAIHPSQLRPPSRRQSLKSRSDTVEEIPLAEFITAMSIDIPQLELYSTVANQLSGWIKESGKIFQQANEEASKVTPGVFRDFAEADESDREFLKHQLKLIKANNHETAKSQWYDWKGDWIEQLRETAEATFTDLESDAKLLENINAQVQTMLPMLQNEYEQLEKELAQELADVAEAKDCDQDFLDELKATIAEQDSELETYRADVSEAKAKLTRLEEKLVEIESQKQEASTAISQAERVIHLQKESTSAEVFRLKDELEALQDLHLWRCNKVNADVVELVYGSRYQVTIPCRAFKPITTRFDVRKSKGLQLKERDPFPQFTQLMLDGARYLVLQAGEDISPQQIVQLLGDFWSSCTQFKSQLTFLAIKYPLAVETQTVTESPPNLVARATVLFPSMKSKARISFLLDAQTYSKWPMSIQSLKTEVDVAYGRIDREVILNAVLGRLAQATPSDNHGCLLDACIEATEQYS